jgi:hypothetical protein
MAELTAHRTLALREAVANDPGTAFLAMLHALCLKLFYRFGLDSCLEVEAKSVLFGTQIEGLGDMPYATAVDARHGTWAAQLPKDVDHRCRHRGPVDHRACVWSPRLAGVESIQLGGGIADEFEAVAALDQGQPLRDQALKLDRPDL